MDFRGEIRERLQDFEGGQIHQFAWLCGLRALPFLSTKKTYVSFIYWSEDARQEHLYSIFNALDACAERKLKGATTANVAVAANAANRAKVAAYADAAAANAANAVAHVVATVCDVAGVDTIIDNAASAAAYADDAADVAANAAAYADDATTYLTANTYVADHVKTFLKKILHKDNVRTSLEKILHKDIEAIKTGNLTALNNDTSIYGEIWHNFLDDLNGIGCGYWAQLYEDMFRCRFVIGEKELERRLNVPGEIKVQGAAAVGEYLERLGDNTELFSEARIIILGEKGAGKTSLARRLFDIDAEMPKEYESTEGVDTSIWNFPDRDGNKKINVHVWDFAGHSITHSAHRCFMSVRCLYIYVYDGRKERNNDPAYWLEQIRIHGGDSPVLILINEKDDHNADIAEKTLKNEYPSIKGYYRVDIGSEDKTELEKFRLMVMEEVRNNPSWNNQIVSSEAYKIKNDLCVFFEESKSPHITREQFDVIAKRCGVDGKRAEAILGDLHALGVCLWYNEVEMQKFRMLVLNPDWITNGIYRIINNGFKERKRKLTVLDAVEMLRNDTHYQYPCDKVKYLFELMKVYELAFFENENADHIFIPAILSVDSPDELPDFPYGERLTMSFAVDKTLPPNMVSRLVVQRHKEAENKEQLWRKGAVLYYGEGNAIAIITEDGRNIKIQVKGADKTAYLTSLRETLKDIFESYKAIKPDLWYEVLMPEEMKEEPHSLQLAGKSNKESLMLKEEVITGYLRAERHYFDAPNERDIPLERTGREYKISNFFSAPVSVQIDRSTTDDHSTHTICNVVFRNCVVNLQGKLNNLAKELRAKDFSDDAVFVEEVVAAVEETQRVICSIPEANLGETLRKNGGVAKLREFFDEFTEKDSALNKNVAKLRSGTKKIKSIARMYNDLVRLLPVVKAIMPEIPETLLCEEIRVKNTSMFPVPSVISGIASIIDLGCTYTSHNRNATSEETDENAIFSDWAVTGQDLISAARRVREKNIRS
jgi:GTPase SAR1 family protein